MRQLSVILVAVLLFSCGKEEKIKENPTNCAVKEVEAGVEFRCVDKNGIETSGVVKNGENGAQGEKGEKGEKGDTGSGLLVAKKVMCEGAIEGWLENSSYVFDVQMSIFETGDSFIGARVQMMRGEEMFNERYGSAFYVAGADELVVYDGQFKMVLDGDKMHVTSHGGVKASLPCKEVI